MFLRFLLCYCVCNLQWLERRQQLSASAATAQLLHPFSRAEQDKEIKTKKKPWNWYKGASKRYLIVQEWSFFF